MPFADRFMISLISTPTGVNESMASQQTESTQALDLKKRFFRINTLIAIVVSLAVVFIFIRRFDIGEALRVLSRLDPLVYGAAAAAFFFSLPLRGDRWSRLLGDAGVRLPLFALSRYYLFAWFANCILPARIGDLYRAYLLKKNHDQSFSLSIGVLFTEKIFDLSTTIVLVLLGGAFYFGKISDPAVRAALVRGIIILAGLVVVLALLAWRSKGIQRLIPDRLRLIYDSFSDGLLKSPRLIPLITIESFIIWLSEALRFYLVCLALGIKIDFLLAVFISQAALVLMSLPLTPAGLGLVELLMFTLLGQAAFSGDRAAAAIIADRLISFWSLIILGGAHYLFSPRSR